jgi:hypothetical protein
LGLDGAASFVQALRVAQFMNHRTLLHHHEQQPEAGYGC